MTTLLPCKTCRKVPRRARTRSVPTGVYELVSYECQGCESYGNWCIDEADAVDSWNRLGGAPLTIAECPQDEPLTRSLVGEDEPVKPLPCKTCGEHPDARVTSPSAVMVGCPNGHGLHGGMTLASALASWDMRQRTADDDEPSVGDGVTHVHGRADAACAGGEWRRCGQRFEWLGTGVCS